MVEIDYFKHGLGLSGRSVDNGVGRSRALKHGVAIHGNSGEPWEAKGLSKSKKVRPSYSLDSFHNSTSSGRGAKLGLSIHKNHGEQWELLEKMQDLGRERGFSKLPTNPTVRIERDLPRPLTPARGDEFGRPPAVEQSLRKMRSLNDDTTSSFDLQRSNQHITPSKVQHGEIITGISPFPRIPEHQRVAPPQTKQVSRDEGDHLTHSTPQKLKTKKSSLSVKLHQKNLLRKKKSSQDVPFGPFIHITKPSQERSSFALENLRPPASLASTR